jgi:hypothetical protein
VGSYANTSSCSGAAAANYSFAYVNGTVSVVARLVTVTPMTVTTAFGVVPGVSPSYSGFVNGRGPSVLTAPATCQANTTVTTNPGVHLNTSTCSGATATNYTFFFAKGTVTIVKAGVVITTSATTWLASIHVGRMTFTTTVRNAASGAPVGATSVTVKVPTGPFGLIVVSCSAATNALGVATCVTGNANLLLIRNPQPYTAVTAVTIDYTAGTGNGQIHLY